MCGNIAYLGYIGGIQLCLLKNADGKNMETEKGIVVAKVGVGRGMNRQNTEDF